MRRGPAACMARGVHAQPRRGASEKRGGRGGDERDVEKKKQRREAPATASETVYAIAQTPKSSF